jgi:hypothetical protein
VSRLWVRPSGVAASLCLALSATVCLAAPPRPPVKDFLGICGHTVNFKPDLYAPVCSLVRDYHPVEWDLAKDTATLPNWPEAKNRVAWSPTGTARTATASIDISGRLIDHAEKMPLSKGDAERLAVKSPAAVPISESPVYLFLKAAP